MSLTKTFRTEVVLTLATGVGMGKLTFSDVQELMSWLAGGDIFTHQMPAVADDSAAAAIAAIGEHWEPFEFPQDEASAPTEAAAYAARMIARLGETMEIAPAGKPFHRGDAVIADAVELFGPGNVGVV